MNLVKINNMIFYHTAKAKLVLNTSESHNFISLFFICHALRDWIFMVIWNSHEK
jgi:hypothetical protein